MSTSIISEILHTRANGLMTASGNKVPSCRRMCVAKICDWVVCGFLLSIRRFYNETR